MAGIRLQGSSQVINRYGKPDSKTTVDVSYNALGLKGELNAARRIWVLHILEPNNPVTKKPSFISCPRINANNSSHIPPTVKTTA